MYSIVFYQVGKLIHEVRSAYLDPVRPLGTNFQTEAIRLMPRTVPYRSGTVLDLVSKYKRKNPLFYTL